MQKKGFSTSLKKMFLNKESLFVAIVFLLFFPLKTQFQNLIYFILDKTIYENLLLDLYELNYTGNLYGCLEKVSFMEFLESKNCIIANLYWTFGYSISLIAGLFFLFSTKVKGSSFLKWTLVVISCFSIYNALETIVGVIPYINQITSEDSILYFIVSFLYVLYGLLIFIKLNKEDKFRVLFIALPFCILSGIIWFRFLGPVLLPMEIL